MSVKLHKEAMELLEQYNREIIELNKKGFDLDFESVDNATLTASLRIGVTVLKDINKLTEVNNENL